MRIALLVLLALAPFAAIAAEPAQRFEGWTAACVDTKLGPDCRIVTEAPAKDGARAVRLAAQRSPQKDAAPHLVLTLLGLKAPLTRPRLALAVDGGPPLRLGVGADLAATSGAEPDTLDLKLSDGASRRLLPFLRRGKALQVTVVSEGADPTGVAPTGAEIPLPGFGAAAAAVDGRQKRTDRLDALSELIGGATAAARAGLIRDVARNTIPETLRKLMVARDCPVWDEAEANPSFLAEQSFAADLGSGRTLWAIVCSSGATNVGFALFVEDPSKVADRFEPQLFAAFTESLGWSGVETLSNVSYDPEKRQLTAIEKGRAAGDCGLYGAWEWVGEAFRMIEYRVKEECDGVGEPSKFPIMFRGDR
jgi:hypothetical protein